MSFAETPRQLGLSQFLSRAELARRAGLHWSDDGAAASEATGRAV